MSLYGLVHNDKIKVGPRTWHSALFLEYIKENNLKYSNSNFLVNPKKSIIEEDFKILMVTKTDYPEFDDPYEELVGPLWTIHDDHITCAYTKRDAPIHSIKNKLKQIVTSNRYEMEISPLSYTFADGDKVDLYTDRDNRSIYLNTLLWMADDATVAFKFKNMIKPEVTKTQLQEIVNLISTHVSSAFKWEATQIEAIDNADTVDDLKQIELRSPSQLAEIEAEENGS